MVNLTDLWKAAGSPTYKTTTFWLRQDSTKELLQEVEKIFKHDSKSYLKIKRGRIGGAHTQAKSLLNHTLSILILKFMF